jgi:hypothetical protein
LKRDHIQLSGALVHVRTRLNGIDLASRAGKDKQDCGVFLEIFGRGEMITYALMGAMAVLTFLSIAGALIHLFKNLDH